MFLEVYSVPIFATAIEDRRRGAFSGWARLSCNRTEPARSRVPLQFIDLSLKYPPPGAPPNACNPHARVRHLPPAILPSQVDRANRKAGGSDEREQKRDSGKARTGILDHHQPAGQAQRVERRSDRWNSQGLSR